MTKEKNDVNATIEAGKKLSEEVRAAVAKLRARRETLSGEHAALTATNCAVYRMPLRPSDAKDLALHAVDKWGEEFQASWFAALSVFAVPIGFRPSHVGPVQIDKLVDHSRFQLPVCLQDAEAIHRGEYSSIYAEPAYTQVGQIQRVPMINPNNNIFTGVYNKAVDGGVRDDHKRGARAVQSACFFLGDAIKAKIELHYREVFAKHLGESEESPSIEERRATIAENEKRMAVLAAELETIDAQIADMSALFSSNRNEADTHVENQD